ncbi:MAG TPA: phytanoyl-CoA dioxygenase family protein [Chitinophagaceae bacterium]|nr:phytanoyl-CoA dioxygenase family protein [Chitinophagaceae bacterium]
MDIINSIDVDGFAIINNIFNDGETDALTKIIVGNGKHDPSFRRGGDLYAIRRFLHEVPGIIPIIFNSSLNSIINRNFGDDYFVVKSIYFDKPPLSNWFVAWHQDLNISVSARHEVACFENWTNKQGHWAVQPPAAVLEKNFTMRIHLDDTDSNNGALKVIPGSHRSGITRPDTVVIDKSKEHVCAVPKGGVMIMKPLLMHASGRTLNNQRRRVIHIEFSNAVLPVPLKWDEALNPSQIFSQ